jgi:hypothetical protein
MLVELHVFKDIPLLLHILEISSKLFPASISLLEGETFNQVLVKELVYGCIGLNSGTRIAVPVPDATRGGAFLVDLD